MSERKTESDYFELKRANGESLFYSNRRDFECAQIKEAIAICADHAERQKLIRENDAVRKRLNKARTCLHQMLDGGPGYDKPRECPECGVPVDTLYMMTMLDDLQDAIWLMRPSGS